MGASAHEGVALVDRDRAFLHGEQGQGAALAARLVVKAAQAMGATELVDIESAHVDGCIYIGEVSIAVAQRFQDGGASVSVPTTLNVGALDLLHPELWNGDAELAENGRVLMRLYEQLGCNPTWTCAPYQLPERPSLGSHVAWGESNAIAFANSVLGARTQRYGDFLDIAAAIMGRAPFAGLHTDEGRLGDVLIELRLPDTWHGKDILYPLLGHVVGELVGSRIPVIVGLEGSTEDNLKALGAAAASTGAVALFHVVGVTPEAPTVEAAFGGGRPTARFIVTETDLKGAQRALTSGRHDAALAAVCLGTPHYSIAEFDSLIGLLRGRSCRAPLYVNTGRATLAQLTRRGDDRDLRAQGVRIVTDTCTYNAPILAQMDGVVMTNSAKWAWYAPQNVGVEVVFAELGTCVESAVSGRVTVG